MNELLKSLLQAHGGLDRWNTFEKVSATFVTGRRLMPMKGIKADGSLSMARPRSITRAPSSALSDDLIGESYSLLTESWLRRQMKGAL